MANYTQGTVTPIDLSTHVAGSAIAVGSNPYQIAITPDGTKAYVANFLSSTVSVIVLAVSSFVVASWLAALGAWFFWIV